MSDVELEALAALQTTIFVKKLIKDLGRQVRILNFLKQLMSGFIPRTGI